MPTVRGGAGFAGVADLLADGLRPLGRSATQRSLVEDPPAGRAHLPLDLVRDPAALTQNVGRDRLVAMCFRGSHSGHCFRLVRASGVFVLSCSRRKVYRFVGPKKLELGESGKVETMASQANKDLLTKLADRGEQVVGRITDLPGAKTIMDTTTSLGKRLDEVQKRLRSIDPLEKRVTTLEKRLDKLEGKGSTKRAPAKRTTRTASKTTKKSTTAPKPPASSA
jgi:hypothetical protein